MIDQLIANPGPRVQILGIPVNRLTMAETVDKIEEFIVNGTPHIVVTADSSGIVEAHRDPEFFKLLQNANLVTADSVGVIWAAKRRGQPLPEKVSGVDIFARLCQKSAERGYKLYFLGAAPGVAETAAERCRLRFPGCNIVGARHGFFPAESDDVVAQEIAATHPDVLFVAMGMPRQEKFIMATQSIIQASVAIGVGGTFDVFSGQMKRAPKLVQRMRMEWLFRLIQNPKKFAKAKNLPVFVKMVLRSRD